MHPTARRCVQWAVGLLVVGAVLVAYGPDLYGAVVGVAGANAEVGLGVLHVVLTLVRSVAFPLGAALIGAAIVIQVLAPDRGPGSTQIRDRDLDMS